MDEIYELEYSLNENSKLPIKTAPCVAIDWPPKLAMDLALGDTHDHVIEVYGLTADQLDSILHNPAFRREVAKHEREIRENGVSFKQKARVQAEEYLIEIHNLINDPLVPPSVKLDAIKSVTKWAGLEPAPEKAQTQNVTNVQVNNKIEFCWQNEAAAV
jgi:hypothetical protein